MDRKAPARKKCPACGTSSPIHRDHLGAAMQCLHCAKRFRIHSDGQMVEINSRTTGRAPGSNPALKLTEEGHGRAGTRLFACIAAATLVILIAAWALNPTVHREPPAAELRELPTDLTGRGEAMGRAWIMRDFITMHRLTASEREMELRAWLARHPPPVSDKEAVHIQCEAHVLHERAATAQLAIRIQSAAGVRSEVRQNWVKEDDRWVFMPPDARVASAVAQLSGVETGVARSLER
jgi:hypothetical protein